MVAAACPPARTLLAAGRCKKKKAQATLCGIAPFAGATCHSHHTATHLGIHVVQTLASASAEGVSLCVAATSLAMAMLGAAHVACCRMPSS